ncbi:cell division protein FtsI (penicillin-binding protein 3) [Rubritalea squalenifaciens DSM 18772]|uniref:Cell division protein FtsI (Penicillin-binding protein 3) n=1 Tax=Rubritalea squalenifaciens DSM 18772 TaxID=1123071 RepID=A0A1M6PE31_9BACT|nr:penicillin-binding protein 2 [Rubritalea squalenifaciens]SHK06171.1 cell division protein FtsI (penicillin-binding protein 3) [Rubritalea squalenifaciens DSM 18772]
MDKTAQSRSLILCLVIVAGLSLLSVRLVNLQVVNRTLYAEKAGRSYERTYELMAERGVLLDRNDEIIARTIRTQSVMVDKYHLEDPRIAAKGLACRELMSDPEWNLWDAEKRKHKINIKSRKILAEMDTTEIVSEHLEYAIDMLFRPLGMSREELKDKIGSLDSKPKDKIIYKDLPAELATLLDELISERYIQGFRFHESVKRYYTSPWLATHLTGYVDHEGHGMAGIERSLDEYLSGKNGYRKEMRDITGMVMPAHKGSTLPPKNGKNVKLTLDMGLQAICEEELDKGMAEFQGVKGCIVLMDPHTGEILAMASRPHFNLNNREGVAEYGFNYALQAIYEPGSTFKVVAAASALNEGVVNYDTEIFCHWGNMIDGKVRVPDHHPYGDLPVWKVLQKSSNPGAYTLAKMTGREKFFDYAAAFGFGKKTDVSLAGESQGLLRDTGNLVDFSRVSYGYAVSVTPLQVANAYCVLANGGKLMRPRIVKSIDTNAGIVIEERQSEVIRRVISEKTASDMRRALATVTQKGGTATQAAVPGFTAGGKTGTAVKHDPVNGGYLEGRYTVSFAGMLPAEDPAFVCVVVIDDPQTNEVKRYGGTIAAPIWRETAKRVAAHMNLIPTEPVQETVTRTQ